MIFRTCLKYNFAFFFDESVRIIVEISILEAGENNLEMLRWNIPIQLSVLEINYRFRNVFKGLKMNRQQFLQWLGEEAIRFYDKNLTEKILPAESIEADSTKVRKDKLNLSSSSDSQKVA